MHHLRSTTARPRTRFVLAWLVWVSWAWASASPSPPIPHPPGDDAVSTMRQALGEIAAMQDATEARRLVREQVEVFGSLDTAAAAEVAPELLKVIGPLRLPREMLRVQQRRVAILEQKLEDDDLTLAEARLDLAVARREVGDPAAALERTQGVLDQLLRSLPPEHKLVLFARTSIGISQLTLHHSEAAREQFQIVLDIRSRTLPEDHPDVRYAMQNLANALRSTDPVAAIELEERVVASLERTLPPDHYDLMMAKGSLATSLNVLGDGARALPLFEEIFEVFSRTLPADHPRLHTVMDGLAVARMRTGDWEGARELQEAVVATLAASMPEDNPTLQSSKITLARTLAHFGEWERGTRLAEEVLAARTGALPPVHPAVLEAMSILADFHSSTGRLEEALLLSEQACRSWAEQLPADHPLVIRSQASLARIRLRVGDLEGASDAMEVAHAAYLRVLPPTSPELLGAKQQLGSIRWRLGDVDSASQLFEEVYLGQQQAGADAVARFTAMANYALALDAQGDLDSALAMAEAAHDGCVEEIPEGDRALVNILPIYANMLKKAGRLDRAKEILEVVVADRERRLPLGHLKRAEAKLSLAMNGLSRGASANARRILEEVLEELSERGYGPGQSHVLVATSTLMQACAMMEDRGAVLASARALVEGLRATAKRLCAEAPRVARVAASREITGLCHALSAADILADGGDLDASRELVAAVFGALEGFRALSARTAAIAREAERPELTAILQHARSARRAVHDHVSSIPSDPSASELEVWRARLFEKTVARDAAESALFEELSRTGIGAEPPTASSIASKLDEDSVLVSYLRYRRDPPGKINSPDATESLLAFVLRRDGAVTRVELGPVEPLEELVRSWRERIGEPIERGMAMPTLSTTEDEFAERLRERLLDPCLAALSDRPKMLHLILDDFLHLLPLDALPLGGASVGDEFECRFETSTRRLLDGVPEREEGGTLVAIGGVDFSADVELPTSTTDVATTRAGPHRTRGGLSFAPLIQTHLEVRTLRDLHEIFFEDQDQAPAILLTKAEASKATLFERAPEARWLHLATHGWFAPETFVSASETAGRSPAVDTRLLQTDALIRGFAPESLCGLALAGANRGSTEAMRAPGIITAEELAALDLANCELAVLSACETNVGVHRAGQGIRSLQSALHAAGAHTAVTSLWKVDDAATRRLMELFYTYIWDENLGKAEALWRARATMRDSGHRTMEWAGWVLTGDPD